MTDLINTNLETLNLKNLQTLAKEFKVKNWWNLKKADLMEALTIIQNEEKEETHTTDADVQEMIKKAAKELGIQLDPQETQTPKKKAPKKAKTTKVEKDEENLITLKELAAEFHMKGTKARRLLRDASISRPYGGNRWEWAKNLHVDELNMAREYLKAHTK